MYRPRMIDRNQMLVAGFTDSVAGVRSGSQDAGRSEQEPSSYA